MHWIVYAILSALFAALVAIFGKLGLKGVDTTLATTLRSIIMAIFLVLTSFALNKINLHTTFESKTLIFITLSGIAGALSWLFYFTALKNGPASGVAALDRMSVVFVVIMAVLFLGESFTWKTITGAILITIGAIFMSI